MTKNRNLLIFFYKKTLLVALFFFLINSLYLTAQSNLLISKHFQLLSGNPASGNAWLQETIIAENKVLLEDCLRYEFIVK